ncbi:MAG: hypothetical protein LBI04_08225 [Treponema sp.]|jgi:hypothetical protein|nr:hypothetical protein [Treponema sp.]
MIALYLALSNGFSLDRKRTHIIDDFFLQNYGENQNEDTFNQKKSALKNNRNANKVKTIFYTSKWHKIINILKSNRGTVKGNPGTA